jgi:hypothetical protein
VCLGKVSAHTKEEEKKEKTEFHPPYSQNKNKKLGSSYLSSHVVLKRVIMCLFIGASGLISCPVSSVLVDHVVLKGRSVATSTLFEELALDLRELIPIQPPCISTPFFSYPSSLDK